jgi:tetratricopeptide (TPR) repeat protein
MMAALIGPLLASSCASSSAWKPPTTLDTRDDPAALRPGYGSAELHTWWPLAAPEVAAVRGIEQAKLGDAHALLALAILASGDHRDAGSYAAYTQRVDQFLTELKPTIDAAADDWHRGYELHRAMHRVFFNGERTELGSYDFNQARVTGIFTGGRYNCLSSAALFAVLARGFGLPVRAVVVPTHVFIEMGAPGEKVIEIETTSDTGFDWAHDDRFYREDAARWSGNRGLRPVTFDEYQHRAIIEPYRLMALAMRDGRSGDNDGDRQRLREVAGLVDADDVDVQRDRVQTYINESVDLYNAKAWRTMARLFDVVGPAIAHLGARGQDARILQNVSWVTWNHANALMIVGRTDEAMARLDEGIGRIDAGWPDADKLKNNYASLLNDRLCGLISKKDYATAIKVYGEHRDACRANKVCAGNVGVVYENWSIDHENAGDWQSARQALSACVSELPDDGGCREALADLESRHRF